MHKVRRLWIALKIATHIAPCRPTGASPSHDPVPSSYFAAGDTLGRPDPEEEPVPILLDPRLPRAGQNGLRTVRHNGEGRYQGPALPCPRCGSTISRYGSGCSVAGSTAMTMVLTGTDPPPVVVGGLLPNGVSEIAEGRRPALEAPVEGDDPAPGRAPVVVCHAVASREGVRRSFAAHGRPHVPRPRLGPGERHRPSYLGQVQQGFAIGDGAPRRGDEACSPELDADSTACAGAGPITRQALNAAMPQRSCMAPNFWNRVSPIRPHLNSFGGGHVPTSTGGPQVGLGVGGFTLIGVTRQLRFE